MSAGARRSTLLRRRRARRASIEAAASARHADDLRRPRAPARGAARRCATIPRCSSRFFADVTAADYLPAEPRYEVVYHLACLGEAYKAPGYVPAAGRAACASRCACPGADPRVPSLVRVFPAAELARARGVRPVRHLVRWPSRPAADSHARRLGRASTPQGLSGAGPQGHGGLVAGAALGGGVRGEIRAERERAAAQARLPDRIKRHEENEDVKPCLHSLHVVRHVIDRRDDARNSHRNDDRQHGAAAPQHARRAASGARARRREHRLARSDDRVPPYRHREDGRAEEVAAGRPARRADGLSRRRSRTASRSACRSSG